MIVIVLVIVIVCLFVYVPVSASAQRLCLCLCACVKLQQNQCTLTNKYRNHINIYIPWELLQLLVCRVDVPHFNFESKLNDPTNDGHSPE